MQNCEQSGWLEDWACVLESVLFPLLQHVEYAGRLDAPHYLGSDAVGYGRRQK